jgi:hypothetical protein
VAGRQTPPGALTGGRAATRRGRSSAARRDEPPGSSTSGTAAPDLAGIDAASSTETFAAVKLSIDNWRWQGVPFYLRTDKRLPIAASEVSIVFRQA